MKNFVFFTFSLILAGCARDLSPNEVSFLATVQGTNVDYSKIKISRGGLPDTLSGTRAVTIGNKIHWESETYRNDFNPPDDVTYQEDLALLAHEVTHVWQYQHRDKTGYSYEKVIAEHRKYGDDVYKYPKPLSASKEFLSYRFEQQGQIVEDWLNYRASNSSKAKVYERVIRKAMPLDALLKKIALRSSAQR